MGETWRVGMRYPPTSRLRWFVPHEVGEGDPAAEQRGRGASPRPSVRVGMRYPPTSRLRWFVPHEVGEGDPAAEQRGRGASPRPSVRVGMRYPPTSRLRFAAAAGTFPLQAGGQSRLRSRLRRWRIWSSVLSPTKWGKGTLLRSSGVGGRRRARPWRVGMRYPPTSRLRFAAAAGTVPLQAGGQR